MAKVNQPNARQDYQTSPELLAAVQARYGRITFDAACTCANCVAEYGYVYPEHDALAEDWRELQGHTVWCNPPFGKSGKFAAKAHASQAEAKRTCPSCDGAGWWMAPVYHNDRQEERCSRCAGSGSTGSDTAPRVLLLVQAAVDTRWWDAHVRGKALVLHLAPRPAFVGCVQGINRALALCVYGPGIGPGEMRWQWKPGRRQLKNKL